MTVLRFPPQGSHIAAQPCFKMMFLGFRFYSRKELQKLANAGYTHIVIGLMDEDPVNKFGKDRRKGRPDASDLHDIYTPRHRNAAGKIKRQLDDAAEVGLQVILMTWARLTRIFNETAAEYLLPFTAHEACWGIGLNTERFFQKVVPPGMTIQEAIEKHVVPNFYGKTRLMMTGYTIPLPADKHLAPWVDMVIPQGYSHGEWIAKNLIWLAGRTQDRLMDIWPDILRPDQLLIPGLACYAQRKQPGGALGNKRARKQNVRWGGLETQARSVLGYNSENIHADGLIWWSLPAMGTKNGVHRRLVWEKLRYINTIPFSGQGWREFHMLEAA